MPKPWEQKFRHTVSAPDGYDEVDERFADDNIASDDYEDESRSDSDDEPLEVYEDNSSDDTDDSYEDNSDYGDEN